MTKTYAAQDYVRCETCLGLGYKGRKRHPTRNRPDGWSIETCRHCGGLGSFRPCDDVREVRLDRKRRMAEAIAKATPKGGAYVCRDNDHDMHQTTLRRERWTTGRDEAEARRENYHETLDEITGLVHTRSPFWRCEECGAQNHEIDAECAYCDKHECYVSGETWERFGRPDSFAHIPCDRCGVLFAIAQDYAEMRRTGDYR